MHYKKKLIILVALIVILAILQYCLKEYHGLVGFYSAYIFRPLQSFRNLVFGFIPFSIGDILYGITAMGLIILFGRWIYFAVLLRRHKHSLGGSVLLTLLTLITVYFCFLVGWGANYYKPSLSKFWNLNKPASRAEDSVTAITFDTYLIDKLNTYAPHYHTLTFAEINERSKEYYKNYTDSKPIYGLQVKPSLFGSLIQHLEIEGYYNPFTGESQVNEHLPAFVLPFVICHEMAHQSGISAEGDANLLAYVLGTANTGDSTFNYSCYLNIWFYTNARAHRRNHILAKKLESQLNGLTRAQIDTLEQIRLKYLSEIGRYSSDLYDNYLKMHSQKEGIRSYGNVVSSAWAWEQRRNSGKVSLVHLP